MQTASVGLFIHFDCYLMTMILDVTTLLPGLFNVVATDNNVAILLYLLMIYSSSETR